MQLVKTRYGAALGFGNFLLLLNTTVMADTGPLSTENLSANIALATDYVFRGETQTTNEPAIQGGFDWNYNNFSIGVWASNVDFTAVIPDTEVELDYYGTYTNSIGLFDYNLGVFYYTYPGADDMAAELNYFEFIPSLSYSFSDVMFNPGIYVQYGFSPDYFGEEGVGHNVEGGVSLSFPKGFGFNGWVGYQTVDGDVLGTEIEWTYWSVGLTKSVIGFDLDFRYHGADEDTRHAFGPWLANDGFNDNLFSVSVNRSF